MSLYFLGKGRGRQVIAVARTADLVIIMLDATKSEVQRQLLENELESVGIRLNKRKPNIYFKVNLHNICFYFNWIIFLGEKDWRNFF